MAIDLHRPFTNPITRETFRCIAFDESAYIMEWTVHPGGYVPFEHIHTAQDEIFHIQQGVMNAKIGGVEQAGKRGEVIRIPRGVKHIAYNRQPEALICRVEYRPGLDQYKAMQCFAGLTLDGSLDRSGLVSIPKIMFLMRRGQFRSLAKPAWIPNWMFKLGMYLFFTVGTILGWNKLYERYTT